LNNRSVVIDFRMHKSSGIGTYISNIMPFLIEKFDVTLIGSSSEIEKSGFVGDVKVIECSAKIYSIREQVDLFLKIPRCDVFWSPHYNVPILPIRAKKRLVTIHDVFHLAFYEKLNIKQKIYAKIVINQAVKKSNVILTDSIFSAKEIKRLLNVNVSQIVSCAIKPNFFKPIQDIIELKKVKDKYQLPDDFLLFVGNVKPHKNLKNLLLALNTQPKRHLVIVGKKDGFITGDNDVSQMLIHNEDLRSRVCFTGYVEEQDLPVIYSLAKLFVFPSFYEGFGLPPLEAQACGCPVITSNAASLPEVCGDSVVYFEPNDVESIATKISSLYHDEQAQAKLKRLGFENVKRFSWKKSAEDIADIIRSLV